MKKTFYLICGMGLVLSSLSSCKTVQAPKFASVENVIQLKQNQSLSEVITALGSKPYDVLSAQFDGYTIYSYKYKLVERTESPEKLNKLGGENSGQVVYNGKEKTLFLFFKNDKLESYITTDGRKDSPALIMLNNTIYTITRDKEKYSIIPTSGEGAKESSMPSIGNIGKKKN
jgi:hypothetical protein